MTAKHWLLGAAVQAGQSVVSVIQSMRRTSWVAVRRTAPVAGFVHSSPAGALHQEQTTLSWGKRALAAIR
ncbi:hypothetical protein OG912_16975 [Streptomyces sp. NBC_00464]